MTQFAIAGIQMAIGMTNNVAAIRQRLQVLMHLYPWVEMVCLSELAGHGPDHKAAAPLGEGHEIEMALRDLARQHKIWFLPGSLFEKAEDGQIYNTAPVIDPDGNIVTRYRKMFPFAPYEEGVTPGQKFCVFDVPYVGRFGVSICYDLWFPETTRTLTAMGAEVILNPVLASFIDRPADLAVAQASGAMFQSYIFHINGLYAGGNGYSMVISPSGQVLHRGNTAEEMIPVEVDLALVRRERERGLRNMGQPLKSFRDSAVDFSVYSDRFDRSYLNTLGPLEKAKRLR